MPTTAITAAGPVPAQATSPEARPMAVDVHGLTKRYGRRTVVRDLSLRVPTGAVAGFIGPNGAGKTTTLRMLLGLVRPSSGDGTVLGRTIADPAGYLPRVGALIESPALYPRLSARRNLTSLAALSGIDPDSVDPVLAQVGLAERADDEVRAYSLGMKQRLAIAAALLGDPDLLVLDEPTNGLDPLGIRAMRELVRSLANRDGRPRTVLVSSHLLAEIEQICDWLIVVDQGRLAYQGAPEGLMATGTRQATLRPERREDVPMLADLAAGLGLSVDRAPDHVVATARTPNTLPSVLGEVNRAAHARGITLIEITPSRVTLEDRYTGLVTAATRSHGRTTS